MTIVRKKARHVLPPTKPDSLNAVKASQGSLNGTHFILLNLALLLGNMLVLFNTGAFASISLHATGGLGVSPSHASWMQSYYFISMAMALPVSSWMAVRFGRVRLFIAAMILMASGSLLCSVTDDLIWFLLGRVLQGFFGGLTIPLSQTLLLNEYPDSKKGFAVVLWSMASLSPFTLGPAAGGLIADTLGWRWLFYLNVPLPLVSAGLVWALLSDRMSQSAKQPFDRIGFLLLAIALGCLQTVMNQGQDADWYNSGLIVSLVLIGLLALACFVIWELAERHPLLDMRLFARRNFVIGSITLSVSFLLMYGLLSILLVRLQSVAGYTSFMVGSVLLPLIFLAKPMAAFFHRISHYFDARWLASLNLASFAVFCFWTSDYDFFRRNSLFSESLGSQVLEGFCLGGLFVPLTTLFLSGLTPRRQNQAVELGGMLRVLGGSIASPLLGVIWERRAAFHQSRLIETLTSYDTLGRETIASLNAAGMHGQIATAKLAGLAGGHAAILGLNDTFRLAAWIFLGLAALVWFAHPTGPTRWPSPKRALRETALEALVEEP
ncbi:DHA2 family efflux MFS transporter permease subunit [Methylobacter sp.]|uniref:DHA2 family efflux MFS transporter permease subunit n=1 Tax=Methylobacter sp. TaxID=2051955 RepID=UPI003DA45439